MRKVVDAGFLRSDSIIEYLTADRANELVLTDYLCMESLKGRSTTNFLQQIKHIYKFPRQIQILKGTAKFADYPRAPVVCSAVSSTGSRLNHSALFAVITQPMVPSKPWPDSI